MRDFSIEPLAEDTLLLRFGDGIDAATNARVHAAATALRKADPPGIVDIAPAYASLLVRFERTEWIDSANAHPFGRMQASFHAILDPGLRLDDKNKEAAPKNDPRRQVEIPVCYGGVFGPDLTTVAEHTNLTMDEVVARHTAAEYSVAMLGFAPGFPYLLGLDPALQVPRRTNPRTRVPAGSVAIGGAQTGIYPRELPGGWHLIGRTPSLLFDPARNPPCLLGPGNHVCFRAIDPDEFALLSDQG